MTSEQRRRPPNESEFIITSCMAVMEKLMSEHWESCGCAEMMTQTSNEQRIPEEWKRVMSQMMEFHYRQREGGSA